MIGYVGGSGNGNTAERPLWVPEVGMEAEGLSGGLGPVRGQRVLRALDFGNTG